MRFPFIGKGGRVNPPGVNNIAATGDGKKGKSKAPKVKVVRADGTHGGAHIGKAGKHKPGKHTA